MTNDLDIITGAKGVGPSTLDDFRDAGFNSAEEVGSRTPEELADEVKGVGYSTAISVLKFLEGEGYRDTSNRDDDLERLVELLQDLFEFDNKDRDFGIYKLMNANREKIEQYIKEDLIDKIEDDVRDLHDEFGSRPEEEIKEEVINDLGGDAFDGNSLSQEALDEIDKRTEGPSEKELENIRTEIYNHIYQFLSNYYDSGDFITQRKRTNRSEPYSIPYDGSNTHFHWVTKNQYYSKTSEQFTRFTFNTAGYKICFKTVEDELDGIGVGNSKYLIMGDKSSITIDEDSVIIPFYHRMIGDDDLERFEISASTHNKQSSLNDQFSYILRDHLNDEDISVSTELINKKIDEYTSKNQNDFFIHKDIENFLTEELEEYVKSEVFTYDPDSGIDSVSELSMEKGRIVNDVVKNIVSFVSQLEEFKRKLFEKKKFVKDSEKLVRVKDIKKQNYELLMENEDQISDWEESFNIDAEDLGPDKLDEYPYTEMMVDTKYFESDITNGQEPLNKLIKGDNYQALNFLREKYQDSVKCIYIDPPYNTGNANFAYKDNYQEPTWLSMMYDRLNLSYDLMESGGVIFISVDDNEIENVIKMGHEIFGEENHITNIVWEKTHTRKNSAKYFSESHDFIVCFAKNKEEWNRNLLPRKNTSQYTNPDDDPRGPWKLDPSYANNPNLEYEIEKPNGITLDSPEGKYWRYSKDRFDELVEQDRVVWGEGDSYPKIKRFLEETQDGLVPETIFSREFAGDNAEASRELRDITGVSKKFDYPKPSKLIKQILRIAIQDDESATVLDFFAGSGTTAHAVQDLNRERKRQISYVLVEMIDKSFDITKERIKRTAYSKNWHNGEPQVEYETKEDNKIENQLNYNTEYLELESYNEALDAIEFDDTQKTITRFNETTLSYLLKFGTNDSPVFLDTEKLSEPKSYNLKGNVSSDGVDVIKTFNYLVGLKNWTRWGEKNNYTIYEGEVDNNDVLVVWRHNNNNVSYKKEQDMLDYNKYDRVYINGDSSIENSQPISSVFKRKMMPDEGDML